MTMSRTREMSKSKGLIKTYTRWNYLRAKADLCWRSIIVERNSSQITVVALRSSCKQTASVVDSNCDTLRVAIEFLLPVGNVWSNGWNIACGNCCPCKTKTAKQKWDPFSQRVLLQTGAYKCWSLFQQGKKKNRSFLSILRTTLHAWALPNLYEAEHCGFHSTLEWGRSKWAVLWHKYW